MIKLHNGFEFKYCCASGALGFDGRGYWWERPFIDPSLMAFITKTLTFDQREGNFRWWKWWKTFRINKEFTLNAFDLPNPGYAEWVINIFPKIKHKNIIPSICPFNVNEARLMVLSLNELDIRAIEINISCPNTVEKFNPIEIINTVLEYSKHPVIVKIGIEHYFGVTGIRDSHLNICEIYGTDIVIDAINSILWSKLKTTQSPLHPLEGGMSSRDTGAAARLVLKDIKKYYPGTQVISGNGIFDYEEAKLRFELKADAISFGTVFILTPWRPAQIIRQCENSV